MVGDLLDAAFILLALYAAWNVLVWVALWSCKRFDHWLVKRKGGQPTNYFDSSL